MKHFETTILNTFGIHGKQWLQKLPEIIQELQKRWHLSEIIPVENMTYHYVGMSRSSENKPVVIKIGPDKNAIQNEASILALFKGKGYVRLLDYCSKHNALLLKQALPGRTLKSLYPQKLDFVMNEYVNVVRRIDRSASKQLDKFPTVASWLKALDKANFPRHEAVLLQTAISLKEKLITSSISKKLLHGDLHLDNILESSKDWVCIDPKGVIGEPEFEIAAFDIFASSEINVASKEIFLNRIKKLAKKAKVNATRLRDWFFVRLILSAAWSYEDKGTPDIAIILARLLL